MRVTEVIDEYMQGRQIEQIRNGVDGHIFKERSLEKALMRESPTFVRDKGLHRTEREQPGHRQLGAASE